MFDCNIKFVGKRFPNLPYLACHEIKVVFQKKNSRKQSLKMMHNFYVNQR